ncbi:MAG TPA: NAD(P)-dependent oxidoreductase [Candidatus Limnocylindrales bacterium]|jgi:3-hydroxyisobutyrate dehydrogenase-like beta-hydroxyacid dehydrogenase
MTTVGLVGTGRMGSAMARALARAGRSLVLHNRTRQRAVELAAELGAQVADTPAEVAAAAEVTLTMLADDGAVDAVYGDSDGLLAGAPAGATLVDLSTVRPSTLRRFSDRAGVAGVGLLDAPVSGSVSVAEKGELTLMVGGDAPTLERARPALEPLSRTIFHMGELGSGAAMKLAVNAVIFGLNGAVAEGLVLAEAAGVERALAYDVIRASAAGAPFVAYKRAAFVDPETTPTAFALELAEKDLRLITELATALGVATPQADTNLELVRAALTDGRRGKDFASIAQHLRDTRASVVQS